MNSDPHESAAWRMFGMLDADEAASFDEAMRDDIDLRNAWREMNCLSAAVAAATVTPIMPRAGQLDRLRNRLGVNLSKPTNWLAITGWAAAAALAILILVDRKTTPQPHHAANTPLPLSSKQEGKIADRHPAKKILVEDENTHGPAGKSNDQEPVRSDAVASVPDSEVKNVVKVETKRLIQEIAVLREKLESAAKRDQKRFETVPGMAWPIVMTMNPPASVRRGGPSIALADPPISLTTLLGDALAGTTSLLADRAASHFNSASLGNRDPAAIPIYDAARDEGTLVVTNLPKTDSNESYNLWVTTENGEKAIHVGRLPASNAVGADSFDFSLGAAAIVPTGFFLTRDAIDAVAAPSPANTILLGPR